jgi:anti-sigma regulatory factor (Ser/Thr protein kinase)
MVRDGLIEATGATKSKAYTLKTLAEERQQFAREGLDEDRVWREFAAPRLEDLPKAVKRIWQYGVTEMVNNAIDHSGAGTVDVRLTRTALDTTIVVADDGEGIFLKIQRALNLNDPRESILELAKGKLTTAPSHHSGEGIFFTSRVMDRFEIDSHHLRFSHAPRVEDHIEEHRGDTPGTEVRMRLANDCTRTLSEVFGQFTESEDQTFDKTVVPLHLAQDESEALVSRSQARRVANRFERFKRVELDFTGIEEIGQAFADELFRVYARAHPEIRIVPINTVPAVANMIRRAVSAGQQENGLTGQQD